MSIHSWHVKRSVFCIVKTLRTEKAWLPSSYFGRPLKTLFLPGSRPLGSAFHGFLALYNVLCSPVLADLLVI